MNIPELTREQRWECPNCTVTDVTFESQPHSRMHPCRGMAGLTVPMVPAGTRCKVTAVEREDYIGHDMVQLDGNGRPIMATVVTRDDGEDRAVYAPTATLATE